MEARPIGVCVVAKYHATKYMTQLDIFSAGGVDDGAYYPPQDINIYGTAQVQALRDLCTDALNATEEIKKAN